ncbi:MAG: restriction endonuclease subunit S [Leptospirales bacterium]
MAANSQELKDLCSQIVDCPHSTPKWTNRGVIVLRNQNIRRGKLDLGQPSFTDEEHYLKRIHRAIPSAGDIVITREAPMGEVCIIPKGLKCCLGQRMVLLRPDKTKVVNRYLLYALQSNKVLEQIFWAEGTGSTVSNLRIPDLERLKIPVYGIDEQRAIAHILGTLDDKIELNRRMNETLEAMAQALFKSWFVDFDPVRAKAEGRDTGLPKEIEDLFSDGFEDSELGEIPRGWAIKSFINVVEIVGGGTPKTSVDNYWNGNIPWFSVEDSPLKSDIWVVDTKRKITEEGLLNSSTKILPVSSVIITARGTVGKIALVGVPMAMNQSCYGIRGKNEANFWTYFITKALIVDLKQRAHGSVFDTITRNTIEGMSIVFPSKKILEVFEIQIKSILDPIKLNLIESRTLSFIRDSLLPKLLSGELRIINPNIPPDIQYVST